MRIEERIIASLITDDRYCRGVIPHIKPEYFSDRTESVIVSEIIDFFNKYNKITSKDILLIDIGNRTDLTEQNYKEATNTINALSYEPCDSDWLMESTEQFCKDRAVYNAIMESIKIIDGSNKVLSQGSIPGILSDALGISFDNSVGHDYLDDKDSRYDFYHRTEEKLPFDLDMFNKITKGGFSKKTLNCFISMTGGGKTLAMCHMAASAVLSGKNVLYITMEMAEERIAERIDANLMNVRIDDLAEMDRESFNKRISKLQDKTRGKLIIKEFPTASAHVGHFRALIDELKLKREFVADFIIVDYLNICASQRMKMGGSINSYTYIKSVAEELRGLAVENNVPILTATQTTRSGFGNSDLEMSDTSESIGLPATLDSFFAIIRTEELDELNQLMIKQLKNRYSDPEQHKRFVVGVDRSKMKLYNVEESAQKNLAPSRSKGKEDDDTPVFDKSTRRSDFSDFKFKG